jgi:hypothetical protein
MTLRPLGRGATLAGAAIALNNRSPPLAPSLERHPEEVTRALPGDQLVAQPVTSATHAITIRAPASTSGRSRSSWARTAWVGAANNRDPGMERAALR